MQTRLLAILAALFAAIALIAGCSSKSQDASKPLPDAAGLLKESSETTKSQSSVHLKLAVQGEIKELPIESLEGDFLTNTPAVAAQGAGQHPLPGTAARGCRLRRRRRLRSSPHSPRAPIRTSARPSTSMTCRPSSTPTAGLANVLTNFSGPKADGRENLNGVDTVRVTGTVSADAVNKIAPQIAATGPVPATAWIGEDGNHELVQAKLERRQATASR